MALPSFSSQFSSSWRPSRFPSSKCALLPAAAAWLLLTPAAPQVKSTVAIQALAPRVKELQARYAGEPETLQVETARLYKTAGVNPLAGCLPTLATIPVFIGLYKALSKAADEGLGNESFFWIPDLSGPTTLTERAAVSSADVGCMGNSVSAPPQAAGMCGSLCVLPTTRGAAKLALSPCSTQPV